MDKSSVGHCSFFQFRLGQVTERGRQRVWRRKKSLRGKAEHTPEELSVWARWSLVNFDNFSISVLKHFYLHNVMAIASKFFTNLLKTTVLCKEQLHRYEGLQKSFLVHHDKKHNSLNTKKILFMYTTYFKHPTACDGIWANNHWRITTLQKSEENRQDLLEAYAAQCCRVYADKQGVVL